MPSSEYPDCRCPKNGAKLALGLKITHSLCCIRIRFRKIVSQLGMKENNNLGEHNI